MRLYSWRMEAYIQWNGMERLQRKRGNGTFYVEHRNLSERENQMCKLETNGLEGSMAAKGMLCVCIPPLETKEPS